MAHIQQAQQLVVAVVAEQVLGLHQHPAAVELSDKGTTVVVQVQQQLCLHTQEQVAAVLVG